jgi:hypothetical protein
MAKGEIDPYPNLLDLQFASVTFTLSSLDEFGAPNPPIRQSANPPIRQSYWRATVLE